MDIETRLDRLRAEQMRTRPEDIEMMERVKQRLFTHKPDTNRATRRRVWAALRVTACLGGAALAIACLGKAAGTMWVVGDYLTAFGLIGVAAASAVLICQKLESGSTP